MNTFSMRTETLNKYVVDDAGAGRRLGDDPHAIIRGDGFRHPSRLVVWPNVTVAVHSYLDVEVTDEEAVAMARDYLEEIGVPCAGHPEIF